MKKYHLFDVFGIELEYMLVNKKDLKIAPQVDELLLLKQGEITSDVENGEIAWSNELVAHVVELKTNGPAKDLKKLSDQFHQNIVEINELLAAKELQLLPTASHPMMNPLTDTQLWKHSYSEVYALYNRIFNCKGHGWANVQSMHINLPFYEDLEFEKLHAAIRVLLPLLPALAASSPIFEAKLTGFKDSRMQVYKTNQAITPYDTEKILEHHFLNSRGAIARFDRNAIEIRVLDLQECPKADLAIAMFVVEVLKWMIDHLDLVQLKLLHEDELFKILNETIRSAEEANIEHVEFLSVFGLTEKKYTAQEIWKVLFEKVADILNEETQQILQVILKNGSLSTRILKALGENLSEENMVKVYLKLADCLQENKLFVS